MLKFSVITVTKNASATLEKAIQSVAAQRYASVEYIIIDGASDDGTGAIADRYRQVVTRFVSQPDSGIYDAMNKGLGLATGDFIYFLGADDYLVDDDVLANVANFLGSHADCDLAYGGLLVRALDGRLNEFMPPPSEEALRFQICGCLPHQATFTSRRVFEIAGKFDTRFKIAGDYDWFLRVLAEPRLVIRRIALTVACYRLDGVSNQLEKSQAEAYAIQNAFPLYRTRDWLIRRADAFRGEALAQRRRSLSLVGSCGLRAWMTPAIEYLIAITFYPFALLCSRLRNVRGLELSIKSAQRELLSLRVFNERLSRERAASQRPA